jgi:hypothetical protein
MEKQSPQFSQKYIVEMIKSQRNGFKGKGKLVPVVI